MKQIRNKNLTTRFIQTTLRIMSVSLVLFIAGSSYGQHVQNVIREINPANMIKMELCVPENPVERPTQPTSKESNEINKRFKSTRKAISSIDNLVGPMVVETISMSSDPAIGGTSANISKKSASSIAIDRIINGATNSITATVNVSTGEVSIPSDQTLLTSSYGDVVIACLKNETTIDLSEPITGTAYDDGILIATPWVAILKYNESYYRYDGPWDYTFIVEADGVMKATRQTSSGTSLESYNVLISQNDNKDSVNIINFGNYGAEVTILVNEDKTVLVKKDQKIIDREQQKDDSGNITADDLFLVSWETIGSITSNDVSGVLSSKEITLGKWAFVDSYAKVGNFYSDAIITFINNDEAFGWPGGQVESDYETESDGVSYIIHPSKRTATVKSVGALYEDVVIPSTLNIGGTNYTVTEVGSKALALSTGFNYSVSFPATITTVASDAFSLAKTSAVIWNSSTKMPTNAFNDIDKTWTNMLLYVKSSNIAPNGFKNTIVNNVIQNLDLKEDYVFHCPQEFTANNVTFTHEFTMQTIPGEKQGWETIALPFDVQSITHAQKGHIVPFATYSPSSNDKPFWLYEWTKSGFDKASKMEANVPYLISMPNNANYSPDYNLAGQIVFSSTNVIVKTTTVEDIRSWECNNKYFWAQYFFNTSDDNANINSVNNLHNQTGGYAPGSIFIKKIRNTFPFEGYMWEDTDNARQIIEIEFADGNPTGIELPTATPRGAEKRMDVYTLSGQRVEGSIKSLPAGVYVIGGKKTIIK